jgi:hypothetical protein
MSIGLKLTTIPKIANHMNQRTYVEKISMIKILWNSFKS